MNLNDVSKLTEWIKNNLTWLFSWFITLIITTVLTIIVVEIKNPILKTEVLVGIFIVALCGALLVYSKEIYKDCEKISLADRVPNDVILKLESKKIIFDDATFTDNEAEVKSFRKLYNGMTFSNETYDRFKIIINSTMDVPNLDGITLTRNKKAMELNKIEKKTIQSMRCIEINSDDYGTDLNLVEPVRKNIEFFIPLHLKAGKTCNFEIGYRTKAYENAIKSQEDFTEIRVNRIINKLMIKIILEGEMKKKFKISQCLETDGIPLSYKIFDASHERMKRTESQLDDKPIYKNDYAIWEIENPKIGYVYRMYFRLLPKEKYT